jgi:predicted DNA-binding transcriptional regulator AlpA
MPVTTRQLLTIAETASLARVNRKTLGFWARDPANTFPKPIRLSGRTVRYDLAEIEAWLGRARTWVNRVMEHGETTSSATG